MPRRLTSCFRSSADHDWLTDQRLPGQPGVGYAGDNTREDPHATWIGFGTLGPPGGPGHRAEACFALRDNTRHPHRRQQLCAICRLLAWSVPRGWRDNPCDTSQSLRSAMGMSLGSARDRILSKVRTTGDVACRSPGTFTGQRSDDVLAMRRATSATATSTASAKTGLRFTFRSILSYRRS